MKDLGAVKWILDMRIHRNKKNGKIWLSQQKHMENILVKFETKDVKLFNDPLASQFFFEFVS